MTRNWNFHLWPGIYLDQQYHNIRRVWKVWSTFAFVYRWTQGWLVDHYTPTQQKHNKTPSCQQGRLKIYRSNFLDFSRLSAILPKPTDKKKSLHSWPCFTQKYASIYIIIALKHSHDPGPNIIVWPGAEIGAVMGAVVVIDGASVVVGSDSEFSTVVAENGQNLWGGRLACFGFLALACSGLLASSIGCNILLLALMNLKILITNLYLVEISILFALPC